MVNVSVKVESTFQGRINVSYIESNKDFKYLVQHVSDLFHLETNKSFTIKFLDDDNDPCTISSELEFKEAMRLTLATDKEPELNLHIFPGVPEAPGLLCPGEDKSIYRRGAFRRKKIYHLNGHSFQPRRFNKLTSCVYCGDQIWGLGRQGLKCLHCKLMVHKKCHKLLDKKCTGEYESSRSFKSSQLEAKTPIPRLGTGRHDKKKFLQPNKSNRSISSEHQQVGEELVVEETGARQQLYSLEDFDLIRVIGRGSYAKVLLVELKETKRRYAMKVIKKELFADDEEIDWVQTEKHVYELATGCEFMVGLHSCFQTDSKLFFVIEFVNGGDLMFHMQRKRRLPEDHAKFYAAEISLALNYLHEKYIIYRDLKLDNVLLDQYGHIKLTDYGMCKEGIRPGETTSTFCGTPNYIAPEIISGCDYSFSVDWWALGVLLYEMLIGQSPFDIIDGHKDGANDPKGETSEDLLFRSIINKKIYIPRSISVKARNVLNGFLDRCPETRLGCAPNGAGFAAIKNHPFFKTLDWELLVEKKIQPPYVPRIEKDILENFDPTFTKEPIELTPPDTDVIAKIDQSEFEGFEFINPEIMTVEEAV